MHVHVRVGWHNINFAKTVPTHQVNLNTEVTHRVSVSCYPYLYAHTHTHTHAYTRTHLHPSGQCEDYELPFQGMVPPDPSFEEMRRLVVVEKRQPTIPTRWHNDEVMMMSLIVTSMLSTSWNRI